jgi:exonuclease SbcD
VKAVLTDGVPIIDAMKRLREVFPNACELTYVRDEEAAADMAAPQLLAKATTPIEVVSSFLNYVGSDDGMGKELEVASAAIQHIQRGEPT